MITRRVINATRYEQQDSRRPRCRHTAVASQGRNCLILTNWTAHLDKLADALRAMGHDPVVLRGGMGAKARAAAPARLQPQPGGPPLLAAWRPARTPGKDSTAPRWTPSSSPHPSPRRTARPVRRPGA